MEYQFSDFEKDVIAAAMNTKVEHIQHFTEQDLKDVVELLAAAGYTLVPANFAIASTHGFV